MNNSSIDISKLKKNLKLKDNKFVGLFCKKADGNYSIEDIRRTDFSPLIYKNGKRQSQIPFQASRSLQIIDGAYYEFTWSCIGKKEKSNYEFVVDLDEEIVLVKAKEIVERLHNAIVDYPAGAGDKIVKMLETLSKDLTASGKEIFIYELLQNANDYPNSDNELVDVEFHITNHYLIFKHSGSIFTPKNVAALCDINDKDKVDNTKTIGYKGIGFKTVFLDNDYVYLKTGDFSFRFDNEYTDEMVGTPYQILPIWTDSKECDDEITQVFKDDDFRVQFALRPRFTDTLRTATNNYVKMFSNVFANERVILFIPNLASVRVFYSGSESPDISVNKQSDNWLVTEFQEEVDKEIQQAINKEIDKQEDSGIYKIPPKYYNFERTSISFACQKKGNSLIAVDDANIYCYLPTKAKFGFKFLINTDMVPNGSRDDIEPLELNFQLSELAGRKFFLWIKELIESQEYDLDSIFKLIPNFEDCIEKHQKHIQFIQGFQKGFEDCLQEDVLIPVLEDGQYCLKNINKIIYDTTGISRTGILSDSELLLFADGYDWDSEEDEFFPHPAIRGKQNFLRFFKRYHCEKLEFENTQVLSLCDNEDFIKWLSVENNNNGFLHFVLEQDLFESFAEAKKPILLGQDGEPYCCGDLYYDIEDIVYDLACFADEMPRLSLNTKSLLERFTSKWDDDKKVLFKQFSIKETIGAFLEEDNSVKKYFSEKCMSVRFIHFLATHYDEGRNIISDYYIPFYNTEDICINSFDDKLVFYPFDNENTIIQQKWLSAGWIEFISRDYFVKDETAVRKLLRGANVRPFTHEILINEVINNSDYSKLIKKNLRDLETCISFAHYCYSQKDKFQDNALVDFNIAVINNEGETVFGVASNDTYFCTDQYLETQKLEWIDSSGIYSLSQEYFDGVSSTHFKEFMTSKFGVQEMTANKLFDNVILPSSKEIKALLRESIETNVDFWRWIKDNCDIRAFELKDWPIFVQKQDEEDYCCIQSTDAYLSNGYFEGNKGIESLVRKYYPNTGFVIEDYLIENVEKEKKEWKRFFELLEVKTSIRELLLSEIIPHLSALKDPSIPTLLASERDVYQEKWNDIVPNLRKINLQANDGNFYCIDNCILVNCQSKYIEPFVGLIIPNEYNLKKVSSEVKRLLLDIADTFNDQSFVITNPNDWQKKKIEVYLDKQDNKEVDKALHLSVVRELLSLPEKDRQELQEYGESILLLSSNDEWKAPKELTLGTIYKPLCDFEANGIGSDLRDYLSPEYGLGIEKPFREFFNQIRRGFESDDFDYLKYDQFAHYFWGTYLFGDKNPSKANNQLHILALIKNGELNNKPCIPTNKGIMSPNELYDINLRHYLRGVSGWEDKFPSNEMVELIKNNEKFFQSITFKEQLDFPDCLDSLRVRGSKEDRQKITQWLYEGYEDGKYDSIIEQYRIDEKSVWKNGVGVQIQISELCCINPSDIRLHTLFKQDHRVLDASYINESCLEDVCQILGIPFIIDDEEYVDIRPKDKTDQSEHLLELFTPRVLLIAALETETEYQERFVHYRDVLKQLSFYSCESIAVQLKYRPEISKNAKQFLFDSSKKNVFYVGDWGSRRVFKDIIRTIYDELAVELDEDNFEELFDLEESEIAEYIEDKFAKLLCEEAFTQLLSRYFMEIYGSINTGIYKGQKDEDEWHSEDIPSIEQGENDGEYEKTCEDDENVSEDDEDEAKEKIGNNNPTDKASVNSNPHTGTNRDTSRSNDGSASYGPRQPRERTSSPWRPKPRNESNDDIFEKDGYFQEPITSQKKYSPEDYKPKGPRKPVTDWKTVENTPELKIQDAAEYEIEAIRALIDGVKSESEIVDEQYLSRWRMYQALVEKGVQLGDEKEFVNSRNDQIKTEDGGYIYARSAKGGILFVSAFLWDKLENKTGQLCMYYGNKAYEFELVKSVEQLINYVGQDNIIIQIKGKDKLHAIKNVFNGQVDTLNTHALIRIKSNERYNSLFLDTNTGNDTNDETF